MAIATTGCASLHPWLHSFAPAGPQTPVPRLLCGRPATQWEAGDIVGDRCHKADGSVFAPNGAVDCSHGWSSPPANGTRGHPRTRPAAPEGRRRRRRSAADPTSRSKPRCVEQRGHRPGDRPDPTGDKPAAHRSSLSKKRGPGLKPVFTPAGSRCHTRFHRLETGATRRISILQRTANVASSSILPVWSRRAVVGRSGAPEMNETHCSRAVAPVWIAMRPAESASTNHYGTLCTTTFPPQ